MSWVHITDGVIDSPEVSRPRDLVRLADGAKPLWWEGITEAELNACGWFRVIATDRPADTPTTIYVRSLAVVQSRPTEQWTGRPKTADELAADAAAANDQTIRQQAEAALADNRTFLAIASPTNAQTLAQVRALTRQMNGSIRLALGKLDGVN